MVNNSGTAGFNMYSDDVFGDQWNGVSNSLIVELRGSSGSYSASCYTPPSSNVWHHYVAIYDKSKSSGETSLYIDGIKQTAGYVPSDSNNNGDTFQTHTLQ